MIVDTVLISLGSLCVLTGILGCVLPVLPGPALSYAGLVLLQLSSGHPFTITFLVIYAILTVIAILLDYVMPLYGTRKLEGSRYGVYGSAIGLVVGSIFFFPVGIVFGPVFGAFTGELLSGKKMEKAIKPALGSLLGFLAGTALKLTLSISMAYYFILNVFRFYIS
jgi:uncharacterized protein YqgC (DUF456 family)